MSDMFDKYDRDMKEVEKELSLTCPEKNLARAVTKMLGARVLQAIDRKDKSYLEWYLTHHNPNTPLVFEEKDPITNLRREKRIRPLEYAEKTHNQAMSDFLLEKGAYRNALDACEVNGMRDVRVTDKNGRVTVLHVCGRRPEVFFPQLLKEEKQH